jgi:subtilisin family serine protease
MSGPDITPEDYAYAEDQRVIADSERELLGHQLTHLHQHDLFTMQRHADRRSARRNRFSILVQRASNAPAYVQGERLEHPAGESHRAWFRVRRNPSADEGYYRRSHDGGTETAPVHVVAQGSVIKGDSSPEPTARRLTFDDSFVGDVGTYRPPRVAVIDTGLTDEVRNDVWLTELARSADNRDVLDSDDDDRLLDRGAGHGTFVAGIVQQVCPTADITVYRALDPDGLGREDVVAEAIVRAAEDGNEVLTLSFGTATADGRPPLALRLAVDRVSETHPGVLILAAAGNEGTDGEMWPAAFHQVKAVAAVTADGQPSEWSSHGGWVDCSAVGEGIVSTFVQGTETVANGSTEFGPDAWAMWTGTSFVAPQVAGAVARMLQAHREQEWTPAQAYEAVVAGTTFVPGYGRVLRLLPGTLRPDGWAPPAVPTDTVRA